MRFFLVPIIVLAVLGDGGCSPASRASGSFEVFKSTVAGSSLASWAHILTVRVTDDRLPRIVDLLTKNSIGHAVSRSIVCDLLVPGDKKELALKLLLADPDGAQLLKEEEEYKREEEEQRKRMKEHKDEEGANPRR